MSNITYFQECCDLKVCWVYFEKARGVATVAIRVGCAIKQSPDADHMLLHLSELLHSGSMQHFRGLVCIMMTKYIVFRWVGFSF